MKNLRSFAVFVILSVFSSLVVAREWSDNTGSYRVKAEFLRGTETKVWLRKQDGQVISVPVERLSEDDQQYLRERIPQHQSPSSTGGTDGENAKSHLLVAKGDDGRPVLLIDYRWDKHAKPSVFLVLQRDENAETPAFEDYVKLDRKFVSRRDYRGLPALTDMAALREGKEAGSACLFVHLTHWTDHHGVLHLSFPTVSDLNAQGGSLADLVDFWQQGTLHVTLLSQLKPVWTAAVKWPGADAAQLPLASDYRTSDRGLEAVRRQLAALGPGFITLAPETLSSTAPVEEQATQTECPPLTAFPLMERALGKTEVGLGITSGQADTILTQLGKREMRNDGTYYKVNPKGPLAYDLPSVVFSVEEDVLRRCTITYQVAPVGVQEPSRLLEALRSLLGPAAGFIKDDKGRHKAVAWFKRDATIAIMFIDTLHWYKVEILKKEGGIDMKPYAQDEPSEQRPRRGKVNLTVESGMTVPSAIIRLLKADISGIDVIEDPSTLDPHFAEMVLLGPAFYERYVQPTDLKNYTGKAMLRLPLGTPPKIETFVGGFLRGPKRAVPLVHPEFESVMSRYRTGKIRQATDHERKLFYTMIDFEIEGKPVYVIAAKEGRLLIYLEDNRRIKWIEYLDSWRQGHRGSLQSAPGARKRN